MHSEGNALLTFVVPDIQANVVSLLQQTPSCFTYSSCSFCHCHALVACSSFSCARSASSDNLKIRYTSMIDGTGKKTSSSSTGELDRVVDVSVAFVGRNALVFTTYDSKRKGDNKGGSLVFTREPDLDMALAELRVDGIEDEDEE